MPAQLVTKIIDTKQIYSRSTINYWHEALVKTKYCFVPTTLLQEVHRIHFKTKYFIRLIIKSMFIQEQKRSIIEETKSTPNFSLIQYPTFPPPVSIIYLCIIDNHGGPNLLGTPAGDLISAHNLLSSFKKAEEKKLFNQVLFLIEASSYKSYECCNHHRSDKSRVLVCSSL